MLIFRKLPKHPLPPAPPIKGGEKTWRKIDANQEGEWK